MSNINILELKKIISQVDVCMMNTISPMGDVNSRPMLCNHTDNEGLQWLYFYCMDSSQKIVDLINNDHISLVFADVAQGLYANIMGSATIVKDKSEMSSHWDARLEEWWADRENTPNLCMIQCRIDSIRYWYEGQEGLLKI